MKKRACYVVTLSNNFMAPMPNKGEPTNFEDLFLEGIKKHTIRGNYELWKKRFDKIAKDEAYLSIRKWSGKPYASSQIIIKNLYKSDGIGIEPILFDNNVRFQHGVFFRIDNYDKRIESRSSEILQMLAKNDGLTEEKFNHWFQKANDWYAIIHFTAFRYTDYTNAKIQAFDYVDFHYDEILRAEKIYKYQLEELNNDQIMIIDNPREKQLKIGTIWRLETECNYGEPHPMAPTYCLKMGLERIQEIKQMHLNYLAYKPNNLLTS